MSHAATYSPTSLSLSRNRHLPASPSSPPIHPCIYLGSVWSGLHPPMHVSCLHPPSQSSIRGVLAGNYSLLLSPLPLSACPSQSFTHPGCPPSPSAFNGSPYKRTSAVLLPLPPLPHHHPAKSSSRSIDQLANHVSPALVHACMCVCMN